MMSSRPIRLVGVLVVCILAVRALSISALGAASDEVKITPPCGVPMLRK